MHTENPGCPLPGLHGRDNCQDKVSQSCQDQVWNESICKIVNHIFMVTIETRNDQIKGSQYVAFEWVLRPLLLWFAKVLWIDWILK